MKAVVLSIDAELQWGYHDQEGSSAIHVDDCRRAWRWLVEQCEAYEMPATWAVVGHLFLDSCRGRHDGLDPKPGWFEQDPGGIEDTAPGWFGGSLIEAIDDSPVAHDVGLHTFSHVELTDENLTPQVVREELDRSMRAAEEQGFTPRSFVFPRNKVGHRELLREAGIECYRGTAPDRWYDRSGLKRVGKTLAYTVGQTPPPIVDPIVDEYGLVNVPSSLFLYSFQGAVKRTIESLTGDPVFREVRQGLAELAERDQGVFHLWLHPNNLQRETDRDRMETVLRSVDAACRDSDIERLTMADVAARVRNRQPAHSTQQI